MFFEEIKPKSTPQTTFFLEIGSEKSDLKMVIWENQNYQKEYGRFLEEIKHLSLNLLKILKNHIRFGNL